MHCAAARSEPRIYQDTGTTYGEHEMLRHIVLGATLSLTAACSTVDLSGESQATVQTVYDGFAIGDIALATSTMSPDIVWQEAEGNPYADLNPYVGPDAIVSGLFARLATEWDGFTATPAEYVIDGDHVVVFGRYTAVNKATNKSMNIPFVHSYTLSGDQIVAFQQYTDTENHVAAMTANEGVSN